MVNSKNEVLGLFLDRYLFDYLLETNLVASFHQLDFLLICVFAIFFAGNYDPFGIHSDIAVMNVHNPLVNMLAGMFQDIRSYFATPIIEAMYNIHREYYIIMASILIVILYFIITEILVHRDISFRYSVMNHLPLELLWSILPALIILHFMAMSVALLYISDEHPFFGFHVKVIGHQWYWEYETVRAFDSIESLYTYMDDGEDPKKHFDQNAFLKIPSECIPKKVLTCPSTAISVFQDVSKLRMNAYLVEPSNFPYVAERLLDTEGYLYVPYRMHVKLLITSQDVIHSFTIPSLGIKADAIPGRLNDLHFFLTDNSAMTHYFGQCSELCGVGHAFMPIHMVSI